jgi:iron-sulfur cluster repair protein YtfE (RIC family)
VRTVETETEREEHWHLREHVDHIALAARDLPGMSPAERRDIVERILSFLRGELLPHMDEEERSVYPAVAELFGDAEATAPMTYDHIAIRARVVELAATEEDDVDRLQALLYGLHALIVVHFWKEERLYLPKLEQSGWPVFDG